MTKKIDDEAAEMLLARFCGGPGISVGLSDNEMKSMIQHYIDNGKIYEMPDIRSFGQVYAPLGWVTGFDESKMPK